MADKTKVPLLTKARLGQIRNEKWEIIYREPYGRCIIATADIAEGDVLFVDHPIMTGPKQDSEYICLGCHAQLKDLGYFCSKCSWPLCGKECESAGYHHLECEAFTAAEYKFSVYKDSRTHLYLYEAILPLRCLLIKDKDATKWETILALESHDDLRRGSESWHREQKYVCDFIRRDLHLDLPDALIHTVTGVLDVNCHEVKAAIPDKRLQECRVRGIYPLCAMISHDCRSNTYHTYTDGLTMVMIASTHIAKGDLVTGIYTHLLSGTTERRKHLKYGKFFDCVCARCTDPTELGTYFSALRCTQPKCAGDVICKNPIQADNKSPYACNKCGHEPKCRGDVLCKNPLQHDNKASYACNKCGHEVPEEVVAGLTDTLGVELQLAGEGNRARLEQLLSKYAPLLHPAHYHIFGIKNNLAQLYGRLHGEAMRDLSEEQLSSKTMFCQDVLNVLDSLCPGISRLRGVITFELQASVQVTATRAMQQRQLTRSDMSQRVQRVLHLLEQVCHCLRHEAESTFEGKLCKMALQNYKDVESWTSTMEQLPEDNFLPPPFAVAEKTTLSSQDMTLEDLLKQLEGH